MGKVDQYCDCCGRMSHLPLDIENVELTAKFEKSGSYNINFQICEKCRKPFLDNQKVQPAFEYLIKKLRKNIVLKIGSIFR